MYYTLGLMGTLDKYTWKHTLNLLLLNALVLAKHKPREGNLAWQITDYSKGQIMCILVWVMPVPIYMY